MGFWELSEICNRDEWIDKFLDLELYLRSDSFVAFEIDQSKWDSCRLKGREMVALSWVGQY